MLATFLHILVNVILPVLLVIGLGAAMQRAFPMHIPTLSRLNIYLLVPAFIFVRVYESSYDAPQIIAICAASLIPAGVLGLVLYASMRSARAAGPTIAATLIGGLVFNAGNFGIPVMELYYGNHGGQVQALMVMVSNLSLWCVGYIILTLAHGHGWRGALGYLKLPMIYVLVAAFVLRGYEVQLGPWLMDPLSRLADAIVPVALVTLGAQLALRARLPSLRVVGPTVIIKLLLLPAATALVVVASNYLPNASLHLWPWPGAVIIVASAAPTAVNTLLLTLELDGDADTAADIVFWTTLLAALSVAVVLTLVTAAGGGPEAIPT